MSDLLENFVGRRERLDEDRELVGNRIWNRDKVALGQTQIVREGTIAAEDAEHCAIRTMTPEAVDASATRTACRIYLADHATAAQCGIFRFDNLADELVAGNSAIAHVALGEFEVGAADSRHPHAHDTLARHLRWFGIVAPQRNSVVDYDSAHVSRCGVPIGNRIETKKPRGNYPAVFIRMSK